MEEGSMNYRVAVEGFVSPERVAEDPVWTTTEED